MKPQLKCYTEVSARLVFFPAQTSRYSYGSPLETFITNSLFSRVLDSLIGLDKPTVALMVTSDKVYDNVESLGLKQTVWVAKTHTAHLKVWLN